MQCRYLLDILFSNLLTYTHKWNCHLVIQFYFQSLRILYIAIHGGCTNLHSHQEGTRVSPFSSTSSPALTSCFCGNKCANLISGRQQLTVDLICISLMISNIEHLFMYLLAYCICPLKKSLSSSSALLKSDCLGVLHFCVSLLLSYRPYCRQPQVYLMPASDLRVKYTFIIHYLYINSHIKHHLAFIFLTFS